MLLDILAVVLIPFIVQLFKKIIDTRWSPVLAFGLGLLFGFGDYLLGNGAIMDLLIKGAVIGGTSTGLYSLVKTTIAGK